MVPKKHLVSLETFMMKSERYLKRRTWFILVPFECIKEHSNGIKNMACLRMFE
jgi:hypothetical protein